MSLPLGISLDKKSFQITVQLTVVFIVLINLMLFTISATKTEMQIN